MYSVSRMGSDLSTAPESTYGGRGDIESISMWRRPKVRPEYATPAHILVRAVLGEALAEATADGKLTPSFTCTPGPRVEEGSLDSIILSKYGQSPGSAEKSGRMRRRHASLAAPAHDLRVPRKGAELLQSKQLRSLKSHAG